MACRSWCGACDQIDYVELLEQMRFGFVMLRMLNDYFQRIQ